MSEEKKKELPPWNPCKYKCKKCEDIIWSRRPGEFRPCKCGECFVDQTRYYARFSGDLELVEKGNYEQIG